MPAAVLQPQKRVLGDSTKVHRNAILATTPANAAKRRKLDVPAVTSNAFKGPKTAKLGSSQPKSQFEEEVLEKLTQDINGLKQSNAEKNQQWDRPSLGDFDENKDNLCFQQIEAEEGSLHGKTTVRLFGVTEVSLYSFLLSASSNTDGGYVLKTGHSVLLHVTDFLHYLYVPAPLHFQRADCEGLEIHLDSTIGAGFHAIQSVQMVQRENIFGFQGNQKSPYLKITVTDPKYIKSLRVAFEETGVNYKGLFIGAEKGYPTFDSIQYILRFMIDRGVTTFL